MAFSQIVICQELKTLKAQAAVDQGAVSGKPEEEQYLGGTPGYDDLMHLAFLAGKHLLGIAHKTMVKNSKDMLDLKKVKVNISRLATFYS